jgi:hypothetical protein
MKKQKHLDSTSRLIEAPEGWFFRTGVGIPGSSATCLTPEGFGITSQAIYETRSDNLQAASDQSASGFSGWSSGIYALLQVCDRLKKNHPCPILSPSSWRKGGKPPSQKGRIHAVRDLMQKIQNPELEINE